MNLIKRLKLSQHYHDSSIVGVEYHGKDTVALRVNLSDCYSLTPGLSVQLVFHNVRNFDQVKERFNELHELNAKKGQIDEIVTITKANKRGYIIELGAEALSIDAKSISEV